MAGGEVSDQHITHGIAIIFSRLIRPFMKKTTLTFCAVENSVIELRDNFPWASLQGTVVDIGGGSGHVAILLAQVSSPYSGHGRQPIRAT